MFFCWEAKGSLHQLTINALDEDILTVDWATLKLDYQKNGWKVVCVYQDHNKDAKSIPVRALGRRYVSIWYQRSNRKKYLSEYWVDGKHKDVTADNMITALKFESTTLDYTFLKGTPVNRAENHLLKYGGANALLLAEYRNRDMQKIGLCIGETLKEYIWE